jgi:hypothetical protein
MYCSNSAEEIAPVRRSSCSPLTIVAFELAALELLALAACAGADSVSAGFVSAGFVSAGFVSAGAGVSGGSGRKRSWAIRACPSGANTITRAACALGAQQDQASRTDAAAAAMVPKRICLHRRLD